jgi:hypothetical protein
MEQITLQFKEQITLKFKQNYNREGTNCTFMRNKTQTVVKSNKNIGPWKKYEYEKNKRQNGNFNMHGTNHNDTRRNSMNKNRIKFRTSEKASAQEKQKNLDNADQI